MLTIIIAISCRSQNTTVVFLPATQFKMTQLYNHTGYHYHPLISITIRQTHLTSITKLTTVRPPDWPLVQAIHRPPDWLLVQAIHKAHFQFPESGQRQ